VFGDKVKGDAGDALKDGGDLGVDGESLIGYGFSYLTHGRCSASNEICNGVADVQVEGYDAARHISRCSVGFNFDNTDVAAMRSFPDHFPCRRQT
jgi:hypothetical protein